MSKKHWNLFSLRRLPGLALAFLGLVWRLLDYFGRIDIASRIVESMGGSPALIATAISSIWFSVGLIILGVAHVIFVGEPEKGVQRHPWWPYVGWSVFAVCLTATILVPTYGAIELYIREEVAKGVAGLPRYSPDNPNRPQTPLFADNWGSLSPDQVRLLIQELSKLKSETSVVTFATVPNDNIGYNFWRQFNQVFARVGIDTPRVERLPRETSQEGLMLEVSNPNHLSDSAETLREAFVVANIRFRIISLQNDKPEFGDFIVFIGPPPIRWR